MMEIDKLDLLSHDIAEDKKQELLRLFPEILTEGGKIDLERLKLALAETVDVGKERYSMNWPGKADCFKTIQSPSLGTLRPLPEESVNFDTTENLIIEGDNLEVLKLLQKSYLGKVNMIYIDPPYNTGSDFIYPDNYTESLQTYLEYTGQVDTEGKKFGTNTEADGRFHSKWLNMMYPRLYLARNLLREDGVIFISIDDNEITNLSKLCNEIFGEENFAATFVIKSNPRGSQSNSYSANVHEYVLCYLKDSSQVDTLIVSLTPVMIDEYKYEDDKGKYRLLGLRQRGGAWRRSERPLLFYPIFVSEKDGLISLEKTETHQYQVLPIKPTTGEEGSWRWSKVKVLANSGQVIGKPIMRDGKESWDVFQKDYLLDDEGDQKGTKAKTLWDEKDFNYQNGTNELKELFDGKNVFDFPKPTILQRRMLELINNNNAIVLDFFAGSGPTAHAILDLNKQDGGSRKFILVQLPEPTGREDYPAISDICKERVRRVIKKLNNNDADKLSFDEGQKEDRGFRLFKLAESNFKTWNANIPTGDVPALKEQLELHIDHIRKGPTPEDILYEILLKSGFPLTTPVEKLTMEDKTVFSAAQGALFICLERNLTLGCIRAMAEKKPERMVCLDEGFAGNDQLKANAVQIFKTKGVTSFKTV